MMFDGDLSWIEGISVGHAQNAAARTGCTVVLCPQGAVAGVDVRGAAPGTRETDLLSPGNTVEKVHAVVLSGGSAFGLASAGGVMRYLEEKGYGFDTGVAKVPIVPAAVLFDLSMGRSDVRPDETMGYQACLNASGQDLPQGRIGAGCGATVGKLLGMEHCMPGGIGMAAIRLPGGTTVAAIVAANAVGDVLDYRTNEILAGNRLEDGSFPGAQNILLGQTIILPLAGRNTTIGVVVTDAALSKAQAGRLATAAHDGIAWAIRPAHTTADGDTMFALSYGEKKEEMMVLCATASEVTARAINNAVTASRL